MEALSLSEFDISPVDIRDYPNFKDYVNLDDYNNFKKFIFDKYITKRSNDLNEQLKRNAIEKITFIGILKSNIQISRCFYKLKYFLNIPEHITEHDEHNEHDEYSDSDAIDDYEIL